MKHLGKIIVVAVFILVAGFLFLRIVDLSGTGLPLIAQIGAQASPTPIPSNSSANSVGTNSNTAAPASSDKNSDKNMAKSFTLGKDSLSENGEVRFDHQGHAFAKNSPDGKSVVGCVECHHTDQPKSALKPPLVTSERDVSLTMESWLASAQKVKECRSCHFQDGQVPDGKSMPAASYADGGKSVSKDLNNENAFHLNCNTCHDAAFRARPELKKKPGFATSKDCLICHAKN